MPEDMILKVDLKAAENQPKHVAKILSEYDCDFKESRFNNWELDHSDCHAENRFDCYTTVDIYARGCYVDSRSLNFPIELLSATDEQINLYAQKV